MKEWTSALDGAFAVVLGQNALLLAKIIYDMLVLQPTQDTIITLLFSLINISAIAVNWVSCKQKAENTSDLSFFLDIITLCLFFCVSYIFSENYIQMSTLNSLLIISVFYCIIHFLFIFWNVIMMRSNIEYSFLFMKSNYKNMFSIFIYVLIFFLAYYNLNMAFILFIINFIYWLYILIYYVYNLITIEIPIHIQHANWFNPPNRILKQYIISLKSYLTKPFAKYKEDAAQIFFSDINSGKNDPYIFDGGNMEYYNGLLFARKSFIDKDIIDLGCGTGSLYHWFKKKNIKINSYIGIDFAIERENSHGNIKFIKERVESYSCPYNKNNVVFAVNLLCYLSDKQLKQLLTSLKYADCIIIIEPVQSLFWDAYFNNVQLFYRNRHKLIKILMSIGFKAKRISIDYGIEGFRHYILELSNCIIFEKDVDKI